MNFSISLMVSHKFGLWLHPFSRSPSLSLYTSLSGWLGVVLDFTLGVSPNSEGYFFEGIAPSEPYKKVMVLAILIKLCHYSIYVVKDQTRNLADLTYFWTIIES